MLFQKILEFVQLDCLSYMLSLDVTLYLHFAERARNLHGKQVFPDARDVFTRLSKRHDTFAVNNARLELFAKKQRSYDAIPPT